VHRIARGEAQVQRLRRGEADVLDRHAHDAARDVHGVFAGSEHAAQPVERRVGIRVAHALVQRGDEVVVLLALLVVEQHALLQRLSRKLLRDDLLAAAFGQLGRDFQRIQRIACVAAGVGAIVSSASVIGLKPSDAKAALAVVQRAFQQRDDLVCSSARSV
jgi:hypothetical protein